jgi:hypothetical protein
MGEAVLPLECSEKGVYFLLTAVGLAGGDAVPRTSRIADNSVLAIDQETFVTLDQQEGQANMRRRMPCSTSQQLE